VNHATEKRPRRIWRLAGWTISLLALYFFASLIAKEGLSLGAGRQWTGLAGVLALSAAAYAASLGVLSWVWVRLLALQDHAAVDRRTTAADYLVSQFSKYIPGNVFQYAVRHTLGRKQGFGHADLAAAAVYEAILLACAVLMVVLALGGETIGSLLPDLPGYSPLWALAPLLVLPLIAWLPAFIARAGRGAWLPAIPITKLAACLAGHLAFVIAFAAIYCGILWYTTGEYQPLPKLAGAAAAAWLAGFLVPGAPAGAGLREGVLAHAGAQGAATAEVLAAILMFRIATLLGDFLAFLAGLFIQRSSRRQRA
jgi:glycosyltransferase 2 family protein